MITKKIEEYLKEERIDEWAPYPSQLISTFEKLRNDTKHYVTRNNQGAKDLKQRAKKVDDGFKALIKTIKDANKK